MNLPINVGDFADLKAGYRLPERVYTPDNVQLMLYNAALWNGHRIHFDETYTTQVEGYRGLVIAGPLLGDWLHQLVEEWLGDAGRLVSVEYSNRVASYIGDTLTARGTIESIDAPARRAQISLAIQNQQDDVIAPGTAVVEFGQP